MKASILIFLFTITIGTAQTSVFKTSQSLVHKWELQQFEEAERDGSIVRVTRTKYADPVSFEFKADGTLEVIYSEKKKESYLWKIKGETIEITAVVYENRNADVSGIFQPFMRKNMLFLQRINKSFNGILLKT